MTLLLGNRCHDCDDLIEAHAVFCLGCIDKADREFPSSVHTKPHRAGAGVGTPVEPHSPEVPGVPSNEEGEEGR